MRSRFRLPKTAVVAALVAMATVTAGAQTLNPDISAIGDVRAIWSEETQKTAFELHEVELGLVGALNPYARAEVYLGFHDDVVHIEEAKFILDRYLPFNLSLLGGRYLLGALLGCAGGAIQWALGAALGAKVAAPDRTVVSLVTDGGFVWGCPLATLWSASSYQAPFLTVIFNNQSYGVIRGLVQMLSGTELSDEMGFELGVDIMPPPEYGMVAQACGGYGRTVEDSADVLPALKEAMSQVGQGKPAVVDVRLAKG